MHASARIPIISPSWGTSPSISPHSSCVVRKTSILGASEDGVLLGSVAIGAAFAGRLGGSRGLLLSSNPENLLLFNFIMLSRKVYKVHFLKGIGLECIVFRTTKP